MNHEILKSKLYEFYDGELTAEESRAFSEHFLSCPECREELAFLKSAREVFFKEPEVKVPFGFSRRVMAGVMEKAEHAPKRGWFSLLEFLSLPKWEIAAAISVSLVISSYFSVHYITDKKEGSDVSNPIALIYEQTLPEQWVLSKADLKKEDIIRVALGTANESEELFYEQ